MMDKFRDLLSSIEEIGDDYILRRWFLQDVVYSVKEGLITVGEGREIARILKEQGYEKEAIIIRKVCKKYVKRDIIQLMMPEGHTSDAEGITVSGNEEGEALRSSHNVNKENRGEEK